MSAGKRLHVLHVIGGLQLGGAETLLYRMAIGADPGVRHEIICLGDRDWYSEPLEKHGVTVHHLGMVTPWSFVRGIPGFAHLVRRLRPDVIQSWMYLSNILAGAVGKSAGIPVIWGIHASTLEHVGRPSLLCAYAGGLGARWLTAHVVNCSARSAEVHKRLGYDRAPMTIVPNGYDPKVFFPDPAIRAAARETLGLAPDLFVIGSVARWHSQKDIPNLLAALRLAQDQGGRFACLLIGAGLDAGNEELLSAIRAAGCEDIVRSLGPQRQLARIVQALDLHVLPSSGGEAFPNAVGETMLTGTPNIVTDTGDAAHMVGAAGWVVAPRDPSGLADAILAAQREWGVEGQSAWQARRSASRASILDRFTLDRMAENYRHIWETAVARKS